MNKVKTIITIDKGNDTKEDLLNFIENGVNVFRIDLGSVTYNHALDIINKVRDINKKLLSKVAIMLDTKGPRLCTGKFVGGKALFKKNDKIRIYKNSVLGDKTKFSVDYKGLIDDVNFGCLIKLAGGVVELEVIDKSDDDSSLICKVIKGGEIESNSYINIPGCKLKMDFMNEKNKQDIKFACDNLVDYLSLSFISSVDDVLDVNDLLIESGNDHTAIISKIENEKSLEELDEILKISEGLIIARSDLGAEIPIERIPGIQKRIINKCHLAGKISIVSTDMFNSVVDLPTRAEVSDIANAVLDGTDAVLLGLNPIVCDNSIDVLQSINKIINTAENDIDYMNFYDIANRSEEQNVAGSIISSATYMANKLKCSAIVLPIDTPEMAKKISRFRPNSNIIAITTTETVAKNLVLNFGIVPIIIKKIGSIDDIAKEAKEVLKSISSSHAGDKIIIISGYPLNDLNKTNLIEIDEV